MYRPNLKSVGYCFTVPEIIAIAVLGWGCEPPIYRERRDVGGSGIVLSERALL